MNAHDVRREWAERSGTYSPEFYAAYGSDHRSEAIAEAIESHLGRDASVLELGCSAGRHLAYLHERGFDDLTGVDLNGSAFEVMAASYPDLAAAGTFHAGAIEDVIADFPDDRFDAIYSVETLQHLHPDSEWVYDELVRVADGLIVTLENEGDPDDRGTDGEPVTYVDGEFPLYFRDWRTIFADRGYEQVGSWTDSRDTGRIFRPSTADGS